MASARRTGTRLGLVGIAALACLLVAVSLASARSASSKKAAVHKTKVHCRLAIADAVPAGSPQIALPAQSGDMYGQAACNSVLGTGVGHFTFTLEGSGNLKGTFKQYYGTGVVKGAFVLQPSDSEPTSTATFDTQSYAGTVKVLGGTAAFKGIVGKGKMACATTDSEHYSCTERLKVVLPSATTTG